MFIDFRNKCGHYFFDIDSIGYTNNSNYFSNFAHEFN
jgi:hypothetical protein